MYNIYIYIYIYISNIYIFLGRGKSVIRLRNMRRASLHTCLKYLRRAKNSKPLHLMLFPRHVMFSAPLLSTVTKQESNKANSILFYDLSWNRAKLFYCKAFD